MAGTGGVQKLLSKTSAVLAETQPLERELQAKSLAVENLDRYKRGSKLIQRLRESKFMHTFIFTKR